MTKSKLYLQRDAIRIAVSRLGWPWAKDLAEYAYRHMEADAKRAQAAHKGPQQYSAGLRERIIACIPLQVLHTAEATERTLERISVGPPEALGFRREPDVETVRAAVVEARRRSRESVINSRLNLPALCLSSTSSTT
jgi:hypothetical protein